MTADDERTEVLRRRAAAWQADALISRSTLEEVLRAVPAAWRTNGVIVQIVFFILTAVGVAAFYGFCEVIGIPSKGLIVGVVCLAVGELLIRFRRWMWTGIEAALWLAGLLAIITELPRTGTPEALLVIAAAAAVAGIRVRNPLFAGLAMILVMSWSERRFDLGFVFAIVTGAAAMVALTREWRRPSTEWFFTLLALVMPVAGWFVAGREWRLVTLALYGAFASVAAVLALRHRHHALFATAAIAAGFSLAIAADLMRATPELIFFTTGTVLMTASWLISRTLRERRTGFVVLRQRLTEADELLDIGGTLAAAQSGSDRAPTPDETRPQGEGGFGGAGATGEF